jgi:hypothetical protein
MVSLTLLTLSVCSVFDIKVQESSTHPRDASGRTLVYFFSRSVIALFFFGLSTHVSWQIVTEVFVSGSLRVSHAPFAL